MKHRLHEILHSNEDFKEEDFAKVCAFVYPYQQGMVLLELYGRPLCGNINFHMESLLSVRVLTRAPLRESPLLEYSFGNVKVYSTICQSLLNYIVY